MLKWLGSVRSIITLLIVFSWCFAFACGHVSVEAFSSTVGAIITFYFLKQRDKPENKT